MLSRADISEYRPWRPGDGTRCTFVARAADGFPCGPPVLTRSVSGIGRSASGKRGEVVCRNHVAARFLDHGIGTVNARIEREAREAVIANHWQEYQAERDRRRADAYAEVLAAIPDELRPLIEQGLAQHREAER